MRVYISTSMCVCTLGYCVHISCPRAAAALLAPASDAAVLADARPAALIALASLTVVLADARPAALLALAAYAAELADARPITLIAIIIYVYLSACLHLV